MAIRGFVSHIDLNVADPMASIAFYDVALRHLGFVRHDIDEQRAWWSLTYVGGGVFGIEVRPPAEPAPRDRFERYSPGLDHLAFHAEPIADVDELFRVLTAAGYVVAEPPRVYDYSPGYYAVAFDDPSGIRLEVVYEPGSNP